ncbi:uncharacterized protein N0V89_005587 [Didymosphaeria variabile]|uniref:Uncharacterized protein n=1 Tax=Didymosphaeria variabile TaxID=1932322 RepID=A0A9W9CBC5_9PLEO|nr:uncharacterized protein N0V89_005587 [Didymosphaeria variabile]KAJ4353857.1 hypothetical protein N0V89_005587 [Didymosphaeria variabile]
MSTAMKEINKLRKKAGYNMDFSVGRRTGVEIISDEEAQELWLENRLKKREKPESPVQGVKHFDITELVEDINKDMDGDAAENHKKEIKEIQAAKQEAYMDPDRLAMIQGEWDHSHAAREQEIRECHKCYDLRYRNRRHPVCEEHRTSYNNVLTDVPLCPHIDMRLFWYASDPANKQDSWFFDVTHVHAHDLHAHEACKGSIKSVMNGIDEIIKQVSKTMERRSLRAPSSVSRLIRQLPAVLYLHEVDDSHVETVKKVDEAEARAYAKQINKKMSAWDMKIAKLIASQKQNIVFGKEAMKVTAKEAMKPMKKAGNPNEPKNRFQLSQTKPKKAKPATEETEEKVIASGKSTLQNEFTKAKLTSKQSAKKKQSPSERSKLSEGLIYDSDDGLSNGASTSDTVEEKKGLKRKVSDDNNVSSCDEEVQEPPTKKRKASTKENEGNEAAQQPTSDTEATTSDAKSSEAGKPSSPATELSTEPSEEVSQDQATEDITEDPQNTTEQLALSKKRKTSSNGEFETGHTTIKKRKVSIGEEEKTETVTDDETIVISALKAKIFETVSDVNRLPTPPDTNPATPDAEAPPSPSEIPSLSLETAVKQPLTLSTSRRSSTDSHSSEKSSKSVRFPKETDEAEDREQPTFVSPKVSVSQQGSFATIGDNESMEDEVDYDSGDE